MPITTMSQAWTKLKAHSLTTDGKERAVNHLNEWGGFSKLLGISVFTAWSDLAPYDKATRTTKAKVLGDDWDSAVGVNNQKRWLRHAEANDGGTAAFFIIHVVDRNAEPRRVQAVDLERIFVGQIVREGGNVYIVGQPRPLQGLV
jgi:hypothetical protein